MTEFFDTVDWLFINLREAILSEFEHFSGSLFFSILRIINLTFDIMDSIIYHDKN